MSDLISRADALSCFHDWIDSHGDVHTADEMPEYQRIEQLPSAQPYTEAEIQRMQDLEQAELDKAFELGREEGLKEAQAKTGKWINGHWDGDSNFRIDGRGNCWFVRECSNCHEAIEGKPTRYCPHCGCRMEGEQNG